MMHNGELHLWVTVREAEVRVTRQERELIALTLTIDGQPQAGNLWLNIYTDREPELWRPWVDAFGVTSVAGTNEDLGGRLLGLRALAVVVPDEYNGRKRFRVAEVINPDTES